MAKEKKKDLLALYGAKPQQEFVDTGVEALNELWGGGICPGTMYSFWGGAGCGKSTLAAQCVKSYLRQGKKVLMVDTEKAMNENQQESFGIKKYADEGTFIHLVCDNYDELQDIIEGTPDLGVELFLLDSETMLNPAIAKGQRVTDNQPGVKARQSAFCLNLMKQLFYKAGIASIVIFHERANIQMTFIQNGPATKQAGGFAALHVPDIITHLIPHARVMDGDTRVGVELEMVTEKNKFTAPFIPIRKKLIYGKGISKRYDLIDSALARDIITMRGAGFYSLPWGETVRGTKALYDMNSTQLKQLQEYLK